MTHVIHKLSFGDKLQVSPENSLAVGECSESGLILGTLVLWQGRVSLQRKLSLEEFTAATTSGRSSVQSQSNCAVFF